MNRKQFIFTLSVALLSGFLGGVLSVWFLMPQSVLAQGEPPKVITAKTFRLVDESSRVRAELGFGIDLAQVGRDLRSVQAPHLSLYGEDGTKQLQVWGGSSPGATIGDMQGYQLHLKEAEISVHEMNYPNIPKNPSYRIRLSADSGPVLEFTDDNTKTRLALGRIELKHPDTGSTEIRAPSSLVLFDEEGKVLWSAP